MLKPRVPTEKGKYVYQGVCCAKPRAPTENGKYVHCDAGVCSEKAACAC